MPDLPPSLTSELSRHRARQFADKWSTVTNEKQFAQSFWSDFFRDLIGIEDLLGTGVDFEYPIKNVATGATNFIDVLWKGVVLIEHKSAGKNLDVAEKQARNYLVSLPAQHRPPVIFISDFARFRIVDVLQNLTVEFSVAQLPDRLTQLEAVFGERSRKALASETTADEEAAELMGDLYVEFEKNGYEGHQVSVLLIRILFLLFGDDTRMWAKKGLFDGILKDSAEDGSNLGGTIQLLFQTLDQEEHKRPKNLPPEFALFPYVNGGLFKEQLPVFNFTSEMRAALIAASDYGWADISPAIFGSMFQTVKSKTDRRILGEHYTSITNILKVIRPLFLDDYLDRLRKVWDDPKGLKKLRRDLGVKRYLDPAAGSGNFLVITYQRLREIEHKIIARLIELEGKATEGLDGYELQVGLEGTGDIGLEVRLEQFHAIEYEEWSSQIATVAMYLTDHQLNLQLDELTGSAPKRFPLRHSANIVPGNALRREWSEVCPIDNDTIIMGNPPFYGATLLNPEQRTDMNLVWNSMSGSGDLDYVASWYLVAARHMQGTKARAAFVSTNSITQGQQPPVLWSQLYPLDMRIDFAHRTFAWKNETKNNAAVHCVIVGFSSNPKPTFRDLWSYETVKSDPTLVKVRNINAYLLDADDVLIKARTNPLNPETQRMTNGSKPADDGNLSNIKVEEANEIRRTDPIATKYLRRLVGASEVINNRMRYCLWLPESTPDERLQSPVIKKRMEMTRDFRLDSEKDFTKESAKFPYLFQQMRQPSFPYLAVPRHSSEDRDYVPIARYEPDVISNDAVSTIPTPSLFTFGMLSSRPFNVWTKAVSGRIKNDPRISNTITYNNFPFPSPTDVLASAIERSAQALLDARALYPTSSLAHLYHRDAMPVELRQAHEALDKATLNAYGLKRNVSDTGILETLFALYTEAMNGLLAVPTAKRGRARRT